MSKIRTDFGTDHLLMTKTKNLELAPSGYYHLRIQRNGIIRRISLKTRSLAEAELAAAITPWTPRERPIENTSE